MILELTKEMADAYDRKAARRVESIRAREAASRAEVARLRKCRQLFEACNG